MPIKLRVEAKQPRFVGKIPILRTVLRKRAFSGIIERYEKDFSQFHSENTAPGSGRIVKSARIHGNVRPKAELKSHDLFLGVELTGSTETQGIIAINEKGTRGKGGEFSPIRPRASKVLTLPNAKAGVGKRGVRARQFTNATWIPRGRDTFNPLLVELEPPKRQVGPNHKKPNQFMRPSRKVTRVLMFGKQKVDIRPKHFIRNASFRAFVQVRKNSPKTLQRIVREILD